MQRERSVRLLGSERKFAVLVASPQYSALAKLHRLLAFYGFSLGRIGRIKGKLDALAAHNAHRHFGFLALFRGVVAVFVGLFQPGCDGCGFLFRHRNLPQNGHSSVGCQSQEVFLARRDEQSGHVERTGAYQQTGLSRCPIARGTVLAAWEYHCQTALSAAPGHYVHHRFRLVGGLRKGVI